MNASQLSAFRARSRQTAESLYPATVRIGETPLVVTLDTGERTSDIPGTSSGLRKTQQLAVGAFFQQEVIAFRIRKDLLATVGALDPANDLLGKPILWIRTGFDPMPLLINSVNDSAELFHTLGCTAPPQ